MHVLARRAVMLGGLTLAFAPAEAVVAQLEATLEPLARVVDLDVGQQATVELSDGSQATIEIAGIDERRDSMRNAVRKSVVSVVVNGQSGKLVSATYHLPTLVGGVQVDCPITGGYIDGSSKANVWGLDKAVRIRLWPADSPWVRPATFAYPARQRWFATQTQMANEPVYVDGGEDPANKRIYYHSGLDIGGAEALVEVASATDGLVVSARGETLRGQENDTPVRPRADVVYVLDRRGWYYRYSHLHETAESIKVGAAIKLGDKIGLLGKEGASGGWSHLHFGIDCRQPSGKWGAVEGYAFLWQAYVQAYQPAVIAVARPHRFVEVGQPVTLDGSKSWAANNKITSYTWLLGERRVSGPHLRRTYDTPGTYTEILRVRDRSGHVAYDFAEVQVIDPQQPAVLPPTIHPAYSPTSGIRVGDRVTFKVRSFRSGTDPVEIWDFGDGTPEMKVQSDGNAEPHAKNGYAVTLHRFTKAGDYLVSVRTVNSLGYAAVGRLSVRVGPAAQ